MAEVVIFMIIGAVAVIAAVMMLLSTNAVHAALWLIVNFACVAVLYILLEAPFLAMVQIAVYAGAIMVLFLFVIMLLGADKLMQRETRFRWITPAALVLSVLFLLIAGLALVSGRIDLNVPSGGQPMVRVVHVATDAGPVDVYANGELLVSEVNFRETTNFIAVSPGEYTLALRPVGIASDLATATVTLANAPDEATNAYTIIAFGQGPQPVVSVINDQISAVANNESRVTFFNASGSPVNVVDSRSEFDPNDDIIIVSDLPPSAVSEPEVFEEQRTTGWAFVNPSSNEVVYPLRNSAIFSLQGGMAQLVVLTTERLFEGNTRPVAQTVTTEAIPSFGGPEAIGQLLFTRYLLPFELVSVLLLVAIIGAIVLTQREHVPAIRKRDIRRKVSRPLASVIAAQTGQDVVDGQDEPQEQPAPVVE
jgi:NADH:ubiquinone oxidoreductase subunit 6 (subunit J)